MIRTASIPISPGLLTLIAEIDDFKGLAGVVNAGARAIVGIAADRHDRVDRGLRRGSKTRLTDRDVEPLLASLEIKTLAPASKA
jgi:hypothetical protein